ncbi:MAG: DUF2279 domain-containing protein [Bacteroidota bacterium]|nr:DUF2279 domain-containing protein [Bacteroidota bacterium]MDP3145056.1 DUF2279 domain-containing protein [Bacteroidota bacterium]
MLKIFRLVFFSFLVITKVSFAQSDSLLVKSDTLPNYKNRKIILATTSSAITVGSLIYLREAWFKQYSTGKFHFFNDNNDWLQMDKAGHFYSNYQASRLMMGAFKWAGFNRKQELFIGGSIGLVYMTAVECMDGFSNGWGFSYGDEIANILGASAAISQQAFWNEQRIQFKYSYAQSGLAKYNPDLLGGNFSTQILKDYNGQTYWLSVNPSTFIKKQNSFPKWLNVAFGYSAYGMIGGSQNNFVVQDAEGNVLKFDRERRYYFSLDVDLTRIKTKSKVLKKVFSVINILKFPAPAIQFSKTSTRFYYLYY